MPADCRILDSAELEVDESRLTGESLPVRKHPDPCPAEVVADRACMLYEDTTITAGDARAVVVATGSETEVGRSIAEVADTTPAGGVEARLEELTRKILPGAAAAAAGVVGAGLLRQWPLYDMVSTGVSLAIASVPEGLPFLATAAQLSSARRLSTRNAVVRNPRTIEALGRVDVLCFDKTGTLTEGRLALLGVSDGQIFEELSALSAPRRQVLAAAVRATPEADDPEATTSTDESVLAAAAAAGLRPGNGIGHWERLDALPFEASRGLHAVVGRAGQDSRLCVKGAPEAVLAACSRRLLDGQVVALDGDGRALLEADVARLAARGYRVLAVAERATDELEQLDDEHLAGMTLLGLLLSPTRCGPRQPRPWPGSRPPGCAR